MWLVVGGSGQLGRALSQVLTERKIDFTSLNSNELDIRSESQCQDLISKLRPKVVINAAAWTDVDLAESDEESAYKVNAVGALNLARASQSVSAVLVHISTDYVFSGDYSGPHEIEFLCEPISAYGRTKAAGEKFVLTEYPEASYIFRTAWLYSKWGKNFVKTIIDLEQSSKDQIRVVNDQVGQPTYAVDLAIQIVNSINSQIPFGIYHATNSGLATWFDFATEIFNILDESTDRLAPVSSAEFKRIARRPKNSVLSHECWNENSIPAMRDWRIALKDSLTDF
jgi:dTDP-4-dehydrorhamnose reductase